MLTEQQYFLIYNVGPIQFISLLKREVQIIKIHL